MSGTSVDMFAAYVDSLNDRLERAKEIAGLKQRCSFLKPPLNGEVGREFRTRVALATRRAAGAFFTGTTLARRLAKGVPPNLPADGIVVDPACGVGDLLLAVAEHLPLGRNIRETLDIWGERLAGIDINPQFVHIAKVRLLMLAMSRMPNVEDTPEVSRNLFPLIVEGDFLSSPEKIGGASLVLVNPPYHEMLATPDCVWASGHVSAAAVFMDLCISSIGDGVNLSAILPDVLRSGSRYKSWRTRIEGRCHDLKVSTHGQFDSFTDVHVFMLSLVKGKMNAGTRTIWWSRTRKTHVGRVGDFFDVHVGPVVPHRDPEEGPRVSYVHAKSLPAWRRVKRVSETRHFQGKLFEPPFVLVRRTSRPGDQRAIATVVTGKRRIAVENHLLLFIPKNGTLRECRDLVRVLKSPDTNEWLDKRIRCRHLTVGCLKELPYWSPRK